jgi:ABC-type Fe3+ transport system permease subunit
LLLKAGWKVSLTAQGVERGWSPWLVFERVLSSPMRYGSELRISLIVSSSAALAVVAACIGWLWLSRKNPRLQAWVSSCFVLGWILPAPLLGLLLIEVFNRPGWTFFNWLYDRTLVVTTFAQAVRIAPWCAVAICASWHTLNRGQLELAELEGASSWRIFTHVVAPQLWPAWAAAGVLGFMLALGELGATILVAPPGDTPLSVRLFGLLHSDYEGEVAGICLSLLALYALGYLLFCWLWSRMSYLEP